MMATIATARSVRERLREESTPGWPVTVLLAIPALIPLSASIIFARLTGDAVTGFVAYDMPYYVANAREHFDQGFHLFYGNPYAGYDTPRIYFQPHILLLGCLQQLRLDPGLTYNIFGLAALLFAAFIAVRFYREVVGWDTPAAKLGLVCFFWGGGILSLVGLAYAFTIGKINSATVLHFDITQGWWMLNFGRNLVYPTEAYYHGVFLLSMLYLIRRRFGIAIALAALLSWSHPFTGLEAVLIVAAYLLLERMLGDTSVKLGHLLISGALIIVHLAYYMVFLNQFADHRAVVKQWELAGKEWLYRSPTFVPALFIVGLLALWRLIRRPGFRQMWQDARNRLFLLWFLVVFAFTQHFRVMKALQPIHFAHGYDWMALFFLAAPLLVALLDRLLQIRSSQLQAIAIAIFMTFFVMDNVVWLVTLLSPNSSSAVTLTRGEREVLHWLDWNATPQDMVVSADFNLGYLVSTYTRVRSWEGHGFNTPLSGQRSLETRQAFHDGIILPAWERMHVFYVSRPGWKPPTHAREAFHNRELEVWECPPGINASHAQR